MDTHLIATTTHGRYLTEPAPPAAGEPIGLLVGFHGQSETAGVQMAHLEAIRGPRPWSLVSIQGLHRYYTRRRDVVAAWMTREDREAAIEDNVAYVRAVMDEVRSRWATPPRALVYCGFSQGTAMAYRSAASGGHRASGLIILAGDLPPDVAPRVSALPPVLIGRGTREEWFTEEKARADLQRLAAAGVPASEHVFEGGHEREATFTSRAGAFLDEIQALGFGL